MLVMAVLLLAGTTFLTISSTETQIALNERGSAQAFLLAEAAIHKAIVRLNADPTYPGETDATLGGGTFTVTVATTAGCTATSARNLVASASVPVRGGDARAVVQATVDRVSYPFRWGAFATTSDLIISSFTGGSTTDSFDSTRGPYATSNGPAGGDIGANGDVYLGGNVQVKGDVRAVSGIWPFWGATVAGTQVHGALSEPFPSVTSAASTQSLIVTSGSTGLTAGNYSYTSMSFSDNTSLTTSGGPVTIYVTGNVTLGDNVTLGGYPGTNLTIITKSDGVHADAATFTAGTDLRFHGSLYGKNTDIVLGDRATVFGSIIGRRISGGLGGAWNAQGPNIHFDQAMSDQELCHNEKFSIRRGTWREVIS